MTAQPALARGDEEEELAESPANESAGDNLGVKVKPGKTGRSGEKLSITKARAKGVDIEHEGNLIKLEFPVETPTSNLETTATTPANLPEMPETKPDLAGVIPFPRRRPVMPTTAEEPAVAKAPGGEEMAEEGETKIPSESGEPEQKAKSEPGQTATEQTGGEEEEQKKQGEQEEAGEKEEQAEKQEEGEKGEEEKQSQPDKTPEQKPEPKEDGAAAPSPATDGNEEQEPEKKEDEEEEGGGEEEGEEEGEKEKEEEKGEDKGEKEKEKGVPSEGLDQPAKEKNSLLGKTPPPPPPLEPAEEANKKPAEDSTAPPLAPEGADGDLIRDQELDRRRQATGEGGQGSSGEKQSLGDRLKAGAAERWQNAKDQLNPAEQARQKIQDIKNNINDAAAPALGVINLPKILRLNKQIKATDKNIKKTNKELKPLQKEMDKKISTARKYKRRIRLYKILAWILTFTGIGATVAFGMTTFTIPEFRRKMKEAGKDAADLKKKITPLKNKLDNYKKQRKQLYFERNNLQRVFKEKGGQPGQQNN